MKIINRYSRSSWKSRRNNLVKLAIVTASAHLPVTTPDTNAASCIPDTVQECGSLAKLAQEKKASDYVNVLDNPTESGPSELRVVAQADLFLSIKKNDSGSLSIDLGVDIKNIGGAVDKPQAEEPGREPHVDTKVTIVGAHGTSECNLTHNKFGQRLLNELQNSMTLKEDIMKMCKTVFKPNPANLPSIKEIDDRPSNKEFGVAAVSSDESQSKTCPVVGVKPGESQSETCRELEPLTDAVSFLANPSEKPKNTQHPPYYMLGEPMSRGRLPKSRRTRAPADPAMVRYKLSRFWEPKRKDGPPYPVRIHDNLCFSPTPFWIS